MRGFRNLWKSLFTPKHATTIRRKRLSRQLALEILEDRILPSSVTIAQVQNGCEDSATNGVFRVTRNDTVGDLTVYYSIDASSTATAGVDYVSLSGSVTIPDTFATADINVVPKENPVADDAKIVVVDLTSGCCCSGSTYSIGSPSTAALTLSNPPLALGGGQPISVLEGASTGNVIVATFTDPSGPGDVQDYSADINWGDGNITQGTIVLNGSTYEVHGAHTFTEEDPISENPPPMMVTVTVHQEDASPQVVATGYHVSEVPVVVTGGKTISVVESALSSGGLGAPQASDFQTVATFTDPAGPESLADGSYSANIDWGHGDVSAGVISYDAGTQVFSVQGAPFRPYYGEAIGTVNGDNPALYGQRSMVDSIVFAFHQSVTLNPAAVTIGLHPGVSLNGGNPAPYGTLPTLNWTSRDNGVTWIVTFSGAGVVGNSIADGVYDLSFHSDAISTPDGPGSAFNYTFFRLFGDITGDARVDNGGGGPVGGYTGDYQPFLATLGLTSTQSGFVAGFDYNNDGIIDGTDETAFNHNLGSYLTYSPPSPDAWVPVYLEEGMSYTYTVTVFNEGIAAQAVTSTAIVSDPPVEATGITSVPAPEGNVNDAIVATFMDSPFEWIGIPWYEFNQVVTETYTANIDWGDGTIDQGAIVRNGWNFEVHGTHDYGVESGAFPVTVTIQHDGTAPQTVTTIATAFDPDVDVVAAPNLSLQEGASSGDVILATFTDPGGPEDPVQNYSADIDWGDGSGTQVAAGNIVLNGSTFEVHGSHTYTDEDGSPFNIILFVHHNLAGAGSYAHSQPCGCARDRHGQSHNPCKLRRQHWRRDPGHVYRSGRAGGFGTRLLGRHQLGRWQRHADGGSQHRSQRLDL